MIHASLLLLPLALVAARAQAPAASTQAEAQAPRAPLDLRVEHQVDPIAIGVAAPRFSWRVDDPRRGAGQSAWHVVVSQNLQVLESEKGDEWDSGRQATSDTNEIAYAGRALSPGRTYWWSVRTWDGAGQCGAGKHSLEREALDGGCGGWRGSLGDQGSGDEDGRDTGEQQGVAQEITFRGCKKGARN